MHAQTFNRSEVVVKTPLGSVDQAFAQEFEKGEISGISLMCGMPGFVLEALELSIKERGGYDDN